MFVFFQAARCCVKCPKTKVETFCGIQLKKACLFVGFVRIVLFLAVIIGSITMAVLYKHASYGIYIVSMLAGIGFLLLSILLVVGIKKGRRMLVFIYMVGTVILNVVAIICLFKYTSGVGQWFLSFLCLGLAVIDIYSQIVIRSYYLKMGSAPAPPQNQQASQNPMSLEIR